MTWNIGHNKNKKPHLGIDEKSRGAFSCSDTKWIEKLLEKLTEIGDSIALKQLHSIVALKSWHLEQRIQTKQRFNF
jgi:hypothetical protein